MQERSADVIVVGAGPGGMAAAIEAARSGASVLVLEALHELGGNAIWSTGYLAFCRFDMQDAAGVEDSVERFLADARAEVALQRDRFGIVWDEELTRRFVADSGDTYRFLTALGIRFNRFIQRPKQHTVDRMVDVDDTFSFQRAFGRAFAEHGVDVVFGARARRLLVEDGRVVGVQADVEGAEPLVARARRGVVLAAGGYQAGAEVRRRFQPETRATTPYLGVATCRGDGHVMGQAVGGDLINMTMIQPLVIVGSALVEDCIAVNAGGERFHDECGPYDDRVDALLAQPSRRAHYVFDARTAAAKRHLVEQMPEPAVAAGSLEELAAVIGCPPGALRASVDAWNELVRSDARRDPRFGRVVFPADRVGIVEAPFHAAPMVLGVNFPSGGFRVTTAMCVVDVFGEPVPGLYACGDCVGGVNPCLGLGGIHISSAFTLGRIAGRSAAAGEVGTAHPLPPVSEPPPPRATTRGTMPIVHLGEPDAD